ncbi:MAG: bacillithiol biosynthesis deacetylase BshB1 [Deltaproteobacteria bacterium]|nr:bacillithiol biosynthesis deacetylase BshB1 [Deltaproteobacteria bacterium]
MSADALLIGAHPDDIEIGMGGTAAALAKAGYSIVMVDLTDGEPTPFGTPEIRARESAAAAEIIGAKKRITLPNTNRELFDSVDTRKQVAALIREYKPALLFVPYWDDAHPDHLQAHNLSIGARFYSKFVKSDLPFEPHLPRRVFYYFSVHFRLNYTPSFLFDVSDTIEAKFASLAAYQSQFVTNKANSRFIEELRTENAYWGNRIGTSYAEPFVVKEQLRVTNAKTLIDL